MQVKFNFFFEEGNSQGSGLRKYVAHLDCEMDEKTLKNLENKLSNERSISYYEFRDARDLKSCEYLLPKVSYSADGKEEKIIDTWSKCVFGKQYPMPFFGIVPIFYIFKVFASFTGKVEYTNFEYDSKYTERVIRKEEFFNMKPRLWKNEESKVSESIKDCETNKETNGITSFAFVGASGTGKTYTAENAARYLARDIEENGFAMLKAGYIGQTSVKTFEWLKKLNDEQKIGLINGISSLLDGQKSSEVDRFTKEALDKLLIFIKAAPGTVIRGDVFIQGGNGGTEPASFKKNEHTAVWFEGEEKDIRKLFSVCPGFYDAVDFIPVAVPDVNELVSKFVSWMKDANIEVSEQIETKVREFAKWGSRPEYKDFFAAYKGVKKLVDKCKARKIRRMEDNLDGIIYWVIDEQKQEIKTQYRAQFAENHKYSFVIEDDVKETFDDYIGSEHVKQEFTDVIKSIVDSKRYQEMGISIPKGALLMGPAGTGKSWFARCFAGEIKRKCEEKKMGYVALNALELIKSDTKVDELFDLASDYDCMVFFIDEIDFVGKNREKNCYNEVLSKLMTKMDGFEDNKDIFVLAATNAPESLDVALKRPGRFDRKIEIGYPEKDDRRKLFEVYINKIFGKDSLKNTETKIDKLVNGSVGYTPAAIKNLVNQSALSFNFDAIDGDCKLESFIEHMFEVKETIDHGERRKDFKEAEFRTDCNEGCSATAIHETGHAIIGLLQNSKEKPFEKVTIVGRGKSLGYVIPNISSMNTKREMKDYICMLLGGRAAEEVFYGEDETGAGAVSDLQKATFIATKMVTELGFGRKGLLVTRIAEEGYLGTEVKYTCSEATRKECEEEISNILNEQYIKAKNLINEHKEQVAALAKYIFDEETVEGDAFKKKFEELKK